jgi:hypothetical protein
VIRHEIGHAVGLDHPYQGLLEVCPSETCQAAAPTVRCAGPALDPWPLSPPPSLLLQAI